MSNNDALQRTFFPEKLAKQIKFATAKSLTVTVKDAQKEILKGLPQNFTLRTNWAQPSNKFGIKIKAATKANLTASVGTDAPWIEPHETGGRITPRRSKKMALAVIGSLVRPTIQTKISKRNTPKQLLQSGNAFIMTDRKGRTGVYVFRKGLSRKTKDSILLNIEQRNKRGAGRARNYSGPAPFSLAYGLQGYRTFKKNSAVIEPALRTISARWANNFAVALADALRTAR